MDKWKGLFEVEGEEYADPDFFAACGSGAVGADRHIDRGRGIPAVADLGRFGTVNLDLAIINVSFSFKMQVNVLQVVLIGAALLLYKKVR